MVLKQSDPSNKYQTVRDFVDKVIVKEGGWVQTCCHIPLFAQKLGDVTESRDSVSGIQHFVAPVLVDTPYVPFKLIINPPKPRYERNIVERDPLGRIIHSKPPQRTI